MEFASGFVSILPSMRGFGRQLSSQTDAAAAAAGRSGGSRFSSGMRSAISGIAKYGAATLGAALGGGAAWGLQIASQNEQARISFTTMLGSAQKADAFLRKMQDFAATTPFEFPELQKAASQLISMGVNSAQVLPIMRTLGDVTSGMGTGSEGIERATRALQQMIAAGRIQAEDLNQLRDAGIPVYEALAGAMGKTREEVGRLVSSGDLARMGKGPVEDLLKGLQEGRGLERFAGLMDAQSKSLKGLISTFKDTLGQGLAKAIEPALPEIKSVIRGLTSFVAVALPKVVSGLGSAIGAVRNFISGMRSGTGAAGVFGSYLQVLARGAAAVGRFVSTQLVPFIVRARNSFVQALGGARGFRQAMSDLRPFVMLVGVVLKGLWAVFRFGSAVAIPQAARQFRVAAVVLGAIGAQALRSGAMFVSAVRGVARFASAVGEFIGRAVAVVRGLPGQIVSALGDLGSLLYSAGQRLIQGLIDGILSKVAAVSSAMSSVASKVKGFLPGSPVKEGPLTAWNNGGAGKRLVGLLADGLGDTRPVDSAMNRLTSRMSAHASVSTSASPFRPVGVTGGAAGRRGQQVRVFIGERELHEVYADIKGADAWHDAGSRVGR